VVKKKLPDHSYKYERDNEILVEFSSKKIAKIRRKYGFKNSYDLDAALDQIAMFHEKPSYFNPSPGIPAQKKLLNAIRQYAVNLEDALNRIGDKDYLAITKHCSHWGRQSLLNQLDETKGAVEAALSDLDKKPTRPGPPRKDTHRLLVLKLRKIHQEGTGEFRSFTLNPYSEDNVCTGPLVEFIEEIVDELNAPVGNALIAKTLKEFPVSKNELP
jgi:hypothetical protein